MLINRLGRAVTEKRREERIPQSRAAEEIGIARSSLSRIENGFRSPNTKHCLAIAEWLGVPVYPFSKGVVVAYPSNILSAICDQIRMDPKLTPGAANALCEMMTTVYRGVVNGKEDQLEGSPSLRQGVDAR